MTDRRYFPFAVAVMVVVAVALVVVVLLMLAWSGGTATQRNITACHQRGPNYHYWQERKRCVMYVGQSRGESNGTS